MILMLSVGNMQMAEIASSALQVLLASLAPGDVGVAAERLVQRYSNDSAT
jgi:hypothetical protein